MQAKKEMRDRNDSQQKEVGRRAENKIKKWNYQNGKANLIDFNKCNDNNEAYFT